MYTESEIKSLISSGNVKLFYKDYYWRKLALDIIKENHYECAMCKSRGKYMKAKLVHHVKPLKQAPELAYSRTYTDDTGVHVQLTPLCHACHEAIHERLSAQSPTTGYTNEEKWD